MLNLEEGGVMDQRAHYFYGLLTFVICLLFLPLTVDASSIYWTDNSNNTIKRSDLDGSNVENLVNSSGGVSGIALDATNSKMYWMEFLSGKVRRANLDGSSVEDVVTTGITQGFAVALDVSAGKVYYADQNDGEIFRANMDGLNSGIETLIDSGLSSPATLTLDVASGKMYWGEPGKVRRANLDGSSVENVVDTGFSSVGGIDLDLLTDKVYWTDQTSDKIFRANMDGLNSNVEELINTGLNFSLGIAVDASGGKFYFGDGDIFSANLDGSGKTSLVSGLGTPRGVDLLLDASPVPEPTTLLLLTTALFGLLPKKKS